MTEGTLYATVGLPASGKTTWAETMVKDHGALRINRDDIRAMLISQPGVKTVLPDENLVTAIQNAGIEDALKKGYTVVVDNTNLRRKNLTELHKLAIKHNAIFSVDDHFIATPLEVCLDRNALRGDKAVPTEVMHNMYQKFVKNYKPYDYKVETGPAFEQYVANETRPKAYLVDIDGTLANMHNRSPYDESKVFDDHPNHDVIRVVNLLAQDFTIVLMSGRTEGCRAETERWLDHYIVNYDFLYMRASGDQRKDSIVKHEMFGEHVRHKYNILGVFDDRNQVVSMYREIGLTVFQVADGDF